MKLRLTVLPLISGDTIAANYIGGISVRRLDCASVCQNRSRSRGLRAGDGWSFWGDR